MGSHHINPAPKVYSEKRKVFNDKGKFGGKKASKGVSKGKKGGFVPPTLFDVRTRSISDLAAAHESRPLFPQLSQNIVNGLGAIKEQLNDAAAPPASDNPVFHLEFAEDSSIRLRSAPSGDLLPRANVVQELFEKISSEKISNESAKERRHRSRSPRRDH